MGGPVQRGAKLLRVERLAVLADRVDLEVVPPRLVLDDVAPRAALAPAEGDGVAAARRDGRGRRETEALRLRSSWRHANGRPCARRRLPPLRHAKARMGASASSRSGESGTNERSTLGSGSAAATRATQSSVSASSGDGEVGGAAGVAGVAGVVGLGGSELGWARRPRLRPRRRFDRPKAPPWRRGGRR